jgi:hypothetical protein
MVAGSLSSGLIPLRDAARAYFAALYQNPAIHVEAEVDPGLNWKPSLHFKVNDYLTVIAEVSEKPYPMIFHLRRVDVEHLLQPISIYCVCPEEAYLEDQAEAKKLMEHGYGLLTVDADGKVQLRASCIPVIQIVASKFFDSEIKGMPLKIRQRLAEAYQNYLHSAPSGSSGISEILEGLIVRAAKDAVARKWISKSDTKNLADALDAMVASPQCKNALAALGAVRGYVSMYRNANHHFPKNRKQAAQKYLDCRHSFLDGLKKVRQFRDAMRTLGFSGAL